MNSCVETLTNVESRLHFLEIQQFSRDKLSRPGTFCPEEKSEENPVLGKSDKSTQCEILANDGIFVPREFKQIFLATKAQLDYEAIPESFVDASMLFITGMKTVKNIRIALKGIMADARNHNFWFASRRYYVHSENRKWKEVTSTEFFVEIREKIWRFYRITLCRFLSENGVDEILVDQIYERIMRTKTPWTNLFLTTMLEPYKPLLQKQFKLRVRKLIKVI